MPVPPAGNMAPISAVCTDFVRQYVSHRTQSPASSVSCSPRLFGLGEGAILNLLSFDCIQIVWRFPMMRRCSIVFAITLLMASTAAADDIKVLAANAIKEGYAEIVGQFEKSSGHKVTTVFAGTVAASKRVQDGEIFDM